MSRINELADGVIRKASHLSFPPVGNLSAEDGLRTRRNDNNRRFTKELLSTMERSML
jgi:hypothetical protein